MTATTGSVDHRLNNFAFIRLCAAVLVIAGYAFRLNGSSYDPYYAWTAAGTTGELGIAVFFTAAGFLAMRSWLDDANPVRFLLRRLLRILPGLAGAVLVCALVLGPLVTGLDRREYFDSPQTWDYLYNLLLYPARYRLPGVFAGLPVPEVVNGSLWVAAVGATLYAGLAGLGTLGLLRIRMVPALVFLGLLAGGTVLRMLHPEPVVRLWMDLHTLLGYGAYFFAGAALCRLEGAIPRLPSVLLALLLLFVLCLGTPALPAVSCFVLPYLIVCIAQEDNPALRRLDRAGNLSYGLFLYAFPAQQLVVLAFGTAMGPVLSMLFAALLAFPLAALSWVLVERPALGLKRWLAPRARPALPADGRRGAGQEMGQSASSPELPAPGGLRP